MFVLYGFAKDLTPPHTVSLFFDPELASTVQSQLESASDPREKQRVGRAVLKAMLETPHDVDAELAMLTSPEDVPDPDNDPFTLLVYAISPEDESRIRATQTEKTANGIAADFLEEAGLLARRVGSITVEPRTTQ